MTSPDGLSELTASDTTYAQRMAAYDEQDARAAAGPTVRGWRRQRQIEIDKNGRPTKATETLTYYEVTP